MTITDAPHMSPALRHDGAETGPRPSLAKAAVVWFALAFGALCLLTAAYLAAVELATPPSLWLKESRLFDPAQLPEDEPAGALTARFANWLREPGVHARYARCEERLREALEAGDWNGLSERRLDCVGVVEDALSSMPASSSLWYHHARLLAVAGAEDEAVHRSLEMSYRTGAREGWLAPQRLVFGILRWDLLSAGLRRQTEMDASIMLQSWVQLKALARLYWSNPAIRSRLAEIVERQATPEQKSNFTWLVEKQMKGEPLP